MINLTDDPAVHAQAKLLDWRYRAANWTGTVGAFHAFIGLFWSFIAWLGSGTESVWLPSMLFLMPASIHLTAAVGLSRSRYWAWLLGIAFTTLHLVGMIAVAGYFFRAAMIVNDRWRVVIFAEDLPEPCMLIAVGAIPLSRVLYCLFRCRKAHWHDDSDLDDEIKRAAFEVLPGRPRIGGTDDDQSRS